MTDAERRPRRMLPRSGKLRLERAEVVALLLAATVFVLCVLALPGCVLKVQLLPPPVAVDAATDAWQQAANNRLTDLSTCADVTVRACVDAREAARKEK